MVAHSASCPPFFSLLPRGSFWPLGDISQTREICPSPSHAKRGQFTTRRCDLTDNDDNVREPERTERRGPEVIFGSRYSYPLCPSICFAVAESSPGLCFYSRLHFYPHGAYGRRICNGSTVPYSISPVVLLRRCALLHSRASVQAPRPGSASSMGRASSAV